MSSGGGGAREGKPNGKKRMLNTENCCTILTPSGLERFSAYDFRIPPSLPTPRLKSIFLMLSQGAIK